MLTGGTGHGRRHQRRKWRNEEDDIPPSRYVSDQKYEQFVSAKEGLRHGESDEDGPDDKRGKPCAVIKLKSKSGSKSDIDS